MSSQPVCKGPSSGPPPSILPSLHPHSPLYVSKQHVSRKNAEIYVNRRETSKTFAGSHSPHCPSPAVDPLPLFAPHCSAFNLSLVTLRPNLRPLRVQAGVPISAWAESSHCHPFFLPLFFLPHTQLPSPHSPLAPRVSREIKPLCCSVGRPGNRVQSCANCFSLANEIKALLRQARSRLLQELLLLQCSKKTS